MHDTIHTLLLLALPASGKSELRRYLAYLDEDKRRRDLRLGPTVQLDDFPYVHLMRRASQILRATGQPPLFFPNEEQSWADGRDWGTLIHLLNEDYADMLAGRTPMAGPAGEWILNRLERAAARVGIPRRLSTLDALVRRRLADALEVEAADLRAKLAATNRQRQADGTIVIEFARGGPDGAKMPLPPPYGYAYSLAELSAQILAHAAILYVWVTPEESRRKNRVRANPDDPGSILHHSVPESVMLGEYGCDDLAWLEEGHPGLVHVNAHGRTWVLPVARFDNRCDRTTFLRGDPATWPPDQVAALHASFKQAMQGLP